ncbi:hypothetical protein ACHAWX_002807 [Stephanocyclus meneghinianus]
MMTPDRIVNDNSAAGQDHLLDDISISLSWSSKSSSHNDLNQLWDSNCEDDRSAASREVLDDPSRQQGKTEFEAASSPDDPGNSAHEFNAECDKGGDCSIKAHEEQEGVTVMPLRQWNEDEARKTSHSDPRRHRELQQASMLRKITIGFGIGKLLQHALHQQDSPISNYTSRQLQSLCSIDNFAVECINEGVLSESGWEVRGVHMISPFSSVQIDSSCSSSSCHSFQIENEDGMTGRSVVATIMNPSPAFFVNKVAKETSDCDCMLCHLLGVLINFLFAGSRKQTERHGLPKDERNYDPSDDQVVEIDGPTTKKKSQDFFLFDKQCGLYNEPVGTGNDSYPLARGADLSQDTSIMGHEKVPNHSGNSGGSQVDTRLPPLKELGYPPSISQLVTNLIDCKLGLFRPDDSYPSLDVAINDMQLLLQEPNVFLAASPPPTKSAFIGSERLYGRSNEIASLTNTYCRVASSGMSESIFITGFSGCGKTRLVHSMIESVNISGGFAVAQKFDEMQSSSPLTVVLSAFNELCRLVAQRSSATCLIEIYEKLLCSIGETNLAFLTRILPNAIDLLPSHVILALSNIHAGINFNGLCFTIQQLLRVISCPSRTVLLFLDDLQWADPMSLKLVQSVISDVKGYNCVLFVGGFRENEVEHGHVLLEFFDTLSSSEVIPSMLSLNGIGPDDVNSMISDTLGIFPRLCKGLSDVVFRKTNGNPFFTLEFLRSLIDRDLVRYSLRSMSWMWDLNQISAENITDNVLHLLTRKMNVLSESNQTALKVVSCFGSSISAAIVRKLSSTSQYSSLQRTLDETLVEEGFMDRDETSYRFVHDTVREAAYGLIVDKEQFHFDLGIALQSAGGDIIATANQINRGPPSLLQEDSRRISIVNLNFEASMQPMHCSDFTAAYSYLKTAVALLPNDSWATHYDLTLKCLSGLARAAYSCGMAERAKTICEEIIDHGKCLEDTLETYSLLVSMMCLARNDLLVAFKTCLKVLNLLGEAIPDDVVDTSSTVAKAKMLFQNKQNEDLLAMIDDTTSRNTSIMEFYSQLITVSFFVKPRHICHYYNARWASFCLTHSVACKYTPGEFWFSEGAGLLHYHKLVTSFSFDGDSRGICVICLNAKPKFG